LSGSEVDLQPYVIKQGDHLAKLAYKFGFDADTVWNDPTNAQLRQAGHLSQDPNILKPTDMLYIPDSKPPVMHSLTTGTTNTFVSDAPSVTVTVKFSDATLVSQACTVQELPELTGLATDANGQISLSIPVTLSTATIVFTSSGSAIACQIGGINPVSSATGVFQRLRNLGYLDSKLDFDPNELDATRAALKALKASQASSGSAAPAAGSEDGTNASSGAGASDDGSGGDIQGPTQDGAWTADDDFSSNDDSGLNDDGTVDAQTAEALVKAYGC
jgi:hypothetical protein